MAVWTTPVTDRQYMDVINADYYLARKKRGIEENFENQKGCLNADDLNRIENNTAFLAEKLSVSIEDFTVWPISSVPVITDRTRILENISSVRDAFVKKYPLVELPEIPDALSDYEDFNTLEEIQQIMYEIMSGDE